MKKKIYIIGLLSAFAFNISFAQKGKIKSAEKQYDKLSYVESIESLLEIVKEGNASSNVYERLANAYYLNGNMEEASRWYQGLIFLNEDVAVENYFRYAHALKALGNFTESDKMMRKYSHLKPDDSRAQEFLASTNYLEVIDNLSEDFSIENVNFNTEFSDFGASFYNSEIYFASSRGDGPNYNWNDQPFLNIYKKSESSEVSKISGKVNTKYHESSTSFTKDGNTMYFTRNNYYKGRFEKNSQDIHALKIYKGTLVNNEWTNIVPMPFNNDEYNVAHPALNKDDTKLYFASDMPGTLGASDIFVVDINVDGTYGEPVNLGSKINTEGRENFPFVSDNGTLYFSSDGHVGLGGLDIFKFKKIESISTSNEKVVNMGKPINSSKDDFSYIINESTLEGYLSSNREKGKGDDDIYKFKRNPCTQTVNGIVVDKNTQRIIADADVSIYNYTGDVIKTFKSDAQGAFSFDLPCKKNIYKATGNKETYKEDNKEFIVSDVKISKFDLRLSLAPEKQVAAVGTDLFKLLNLNPIYFDYDKSFIRPDAEIELAKIITYMNEFPNVKVDVRSHTDSRGRDAYNFALSNRRNKSTIDYIVNNGGISAERLSGKGYGETQLTNKCSNGVKCTDAEHQSNRRSEFIVVAN